jgi:hypothetical protein
LTIEIFAFFSLHKSQHLACSLCIFFLRIKNNKNPSRELLHKFENFSTKTYQHDF